MEKFTISNVSINWIHLVLEVLWQHLRNKNARSTPLYLQKQNHQNILLPSQKWLKKFLLRLLLLHQQLGILLV